MCHSLLTSKYLPSKGMTIITHSTFNFHLSSRAKNQTKHSPLSHFLTETICSLLMYECSSKSFCTFFLTLFIKNFKSKLYHFSIQSPCFVMHFSQHPTNFLMPSAKNVFGWARSHWCTAAFTSSLHENRLPLKASLSGLKRWKSDGAKSGL